MKKGRKKILKTILMSFLFVLLLSANGMTSKAATPEAAIGKKNYTNFEDALKNVKNGQTITLKKNVKFKDTIAINRNVKFTLDLNKKTLTYTGEETGILLRRKVNMTIKNGTFKSADGRALNIGYQANVTIPSGTYQGSIYNTGTLTVKNGKFKDTISNYGTLVIKGGTFENTKDGGNLIYNDCGKKITISGGKFINRSLDSQGIYNYEGNITIKGGTFSTSGYYLIGNISKGKITISDGTFSSSNGLILYDTGKSLVIKGGKFTTTSSEYPLLWSSKKVTISGGTFTAKKAKPILVTKGTLVISGGTFKPYKNTAIIGVAGSGTEIVLKKGTFRNVKLIGDWYVEISSVKLTIDGAKIYADTDMDVFGRVNKLVMKDGLISSKNGLQVYELIMQGGTINMENNGISRDYSFSKTLVQMSGGKIYCKNSTAVNRVQKFTQTGGTIQTDAENTYAVTVSTIWGQEVEVKRIGGKIISKTAGYEINKY